MSNEITFRLMRHGRSRADDEGVHDGRYESPFTGVGRSQAEARGIKWKEQSVWFDLIISSRLIAHMNLLRS